MDIENTNTIFYRLVEAASKVRVPGTWTTIGIYDRILKPGVHVDPWKRGDDRTNINMVIMGIAGTGKSTAVKHIALSEYMTGTKIIFLDPESEYKEMTKKLRVK